MTRHLIVDGSNVMHAWPELRRLLPSRREVARDLLLREVSILHDFVGWRVTVIFDGRGSELSWARVGTEDSFVCVHTPSGTTADDVIEQAVANSRDAAQCLIVSADAGVAETVRALGAECSRPEALKEQIESVKTRQCRVLNRRSKESFSK